MSVAEIIARRRKWTAEEKAALLAEVEAAGGRVLVVARRHGISQSLLYNWRSAWKAAASLRFGDAAEVVPLGMIGQSGCDAEARAAPAPDAASRRRREARGGRIEIALPDGARVRVDGSVNEQALRRVLRALRGSA